MMYPKNLPEGMSVVFDISSRPDSPIEKLWIVGEFYGFRKDIRNNPMVLDLETSCLNSVIVVPIHRSANGVSSDDLVFVSIHVPLSRIFHVFMDYKDIKGVSMRLLLEYLQFAIDVDRFTPEQKKVAERIINEYTKPE